LPTILPELLRDKGRAKAQRLKLAMLKMTRIDIKRLQQAAAKK